MNGDWTRSATILARKPGNLNPPYADASDAADAGYKVGGGMVARWVRFGHRPCEGRTHTATPPIGTFWDTKTGARAVSSCIDNVDAFDGYMCGVWEIRSLLHRTLVRAQAALVSASSTASA